MDAVHVRAVLLASRLAFVLEGPLKAQVGLFRMKPYRSDLALRSLAGEGLDEWFDLRWALAAVAYDTAVYQAQQAHPSPEALSALSVEIEALPETFTRMPVVYTEEVVPERTEGVLSVIARVETREAHAKIVGDPNVRVKIYFRN